MKRVRGYVFSRCFMGERVPQHVQNIVIRDYCRKRGIQYLLSATEYAMSGCSLILHQVLEELPQLDGIAAYSLFQLPEHKPKRDRVIQAVLDQGKTLHFAVEGMQLSNVREHERVETLWQVRQTLPRCLN